jgi:5-methylcytosine-specific restriction protein A
MQFCTQPGCSVIVDRGRCERHKPTEQDRPNADIRRLYRTPRWFALRALVLMQEPHCPGVDAAGRSPDPRGCGVRTTQADHIQPHRGDLLLFWKRENLQGLCDRCHGRKTGLGQ